MSDVSSQLIEENKKLKLHIEFLNKKICLCDIEDLHKILADLPLKCSNCDHTNLCYKLSKFKTCLIEYSKGL
jgi:hypothetical protein